MKVSIVMPAYNEEKRIGRTLEVYSSFFEKIRKKENLDYEILVVINNTKDRTEEVVKSFSKKNKRIISLNLLKGGKGYAVIEGFKKALKRKNDLIGFVDADLATGPEEYHKLIKQIDSYDGVIANRYDKLSKIQPSFSFRRLFVSRIFNFIVRSLFLFSYPDTQCGAKLFKREVIAKTIPEMSITQWAFDIDLLYLCKINNFKIKSIPTVWFEKGESKLRVGKVSVQMFFAVIQLRIMRSSLNRLISPIKPLVRIIYKLTGGK